MEVKESGNDASCYWGFQNSNEVVKQLHTKNESTVEYRHATEIFSWNIKIHLKRLILQMK